MARKVNVAEFTANGASYNNTLRDIEGRTKRTAANIGQGVTQIRNGWLKAVGALYAVRSAFRAISNIYQTYLVQARAEAKVENAVRRTGNAAGYSADQLKQMASQLQEITGIGDEQILNDVTAQLLTFGSVAGKVFEKAQKAALDIATVVGTDLKSVTIQLGKVLEDPVGLMSSLSRSGIIFSETQEKTIKSLAKQGEIQEAQLLILQEIDKLYGAQAENINKATGGIQNAEAAWGDFQEAIGQAFAPIVNNVIPYITKSIKGWAIILKRIAGIEDKQGISFDTRQRFYEQVKDYNEEQLKAERDYLTEQMKEKSNQLAIARATEVTVTAARRIAKTTGQNPTEVYNELKARKEKIPMLTREFDLLYAQWQIVSDIDKASKDFKQLGNPFAGGDGDADPDKTAKAYESAQTKMFNALKWKSKEYYDYRVDQIRDEADAMEEAYKAAGKAFDRKSFISTSLEGLQEEMIKELNDLPLDELTLKVDKKVFDNLYENMQAEFKQRALDLPVRLTVHSEMEDMSALTEEVDKELADNIAESAEANAKKRYEEWQKQKEMADALWSNALSSADKMGSLLARAGSEFGQKMSSALSTVQQIVSFVQSMVALINSIKAASAIASAASAVPGLGAIGIGLTAFGALEKGTPGVSIPTPVSTTSLDAQKAVKQINAGNVSVAENRAAVMADSNKTNELLKVMNAQLIRVEMAQRKNDKPVEVTGSLNNEAIYLSSRNGSTRYNAGR